MIGPGSAGVEMNGLYGTLLNLGSIFAAPGANAIRTGPSAVGIAIVNDGTIDGQIAVTPVGAGARFENSGWLGISSPGVGISQVIGGTFADWWWYFLRNLPAQGDKPPLGLTTLVSALFTFFIGSLVFWGREKLSVILTVSMLLLLAGKRPIHRWTERFTDEDVRGALQFLAVTGVILPLAPNQNYGPFDAFNPFKIWLMVVMVTGLGFLGTSRCGCSGRKRGSARWAFWED